MIFENCLSCFHRILLLFDRRKSKTCFLFQIFLLRSINAYLCPNIINFYSTDFSERRPEEVISFFWCSVYIFYGWTFWVSWKLTDAYQSSCSPCTSWAVSSAHASFWSRSPSGAYGRWPYPSAYLHRLTRYEQGYTVGVKKKRRKPGFQAKNLIFIFGGLLFTSRWLNLQHWTGFYIAVYGDFEGLFFDFRGLFFAFRGRNRPEPPCIFPLIKSKHVFTQSGVLTLISLGYFGGWVAQGGGGGGGAAPAPPSDLGRGSRDRRENLHKGRVRCKLQDFIVVFYFIWINYANLCKKSHFHYKSLIKASRLLIFGTSF